MKLAKIVCPMNIIRYTVATLCAICNAGVSICIGNHTHLNNCTSNSAIDCYVYNYS